MPDDDLPQPTLSERLEALAKEVSEPTPEPAPEPAKPVVAKAPAKKAAVKKAPAKKAAVKKAPAKKAAPVRKAPAKRAPAQAAKPVPQRAAPPAPLRVAAPDAGVDLLLDEPAPLAVTAPASVPAVIVNPRWLRVLVALTVLLLAAAAGMGAAALVETGAETWESRSAVRLLPGEAPTIPQEAALKAGLARYVEQVPTQSGTAVEQAEVPEAARRGNLRAERRGSDELVISARAAERLQAERFAGAAADLLVASLPGDQAGLDTRQGDRLSAVVSQSATPAERIRPSTVRAVGLGVLAGATVLLLALAVVVRRPRG